MTDRSPSTDPVHVRVPMLTHRNSEGEVIGITAAGSAEFDGQPVLFIRDDPPPRGSGIDAVMLLDRGTRQWLSRRIDEIERGKYG